MGVLFSGAFWGVFLILIGISVLIKVFFNVDIPIVRTVFGLFIIAIGLSIIMGRPFLCKHPSWSDSGNVVMGEGKMDEQNRSGHYNVVFGKGETDLSKMAKGDSKTVEISTIFGEQTVFIKKGMPVVVKANSAFGNSSLPDGSMAAFGVSRYKSPEYDPKKPYLKIEINTVFGSTLLRYKD